MGFLDAIKSMGMGIAHLPGRINEARFNHATVESPDPTSSAFQPWADDSGDEVVIGKDPDTGEDITIPRSQLSQPPQGVTMTQKQVRTGPSKFGNFVSNGLPRILGAGVAAATSRGDGNDGGALGILRGMSAGSDHLQKQDMIAYNMQRQRQQDQNLQDDRAAQAEERRMHARLYEKQMNADPKGPNDALHQRAIAGGLVPGTPEYQQFMLHGGKPTDAPPKTYEQRLLEQLRTEKDPQAIARIESILQQMHMGGGPPKDPKAEWEERRRRATDLGLKPESPEYINFMANGHLNGSAHQGDPSKVAAERATLADKYGLVGDARRNFILTGHILAPDKGEKPEKDGTHRDFAKIDHDKAVFLRTAEEHARKEIAKITSDSSQKDKPAAIAAVWADLERKKMEAQDEYEQQIQIFRPDFIPPRPNNPLRGRSQNAAPSLLQKELPLGLQSSPFNIGQEDWMRTKRGASLVK